MNQMIEKVFIHDCPHCRNSHAHRVMIDFVSMGGGPFFAGRNDKQNEVDSIDLKVSLTCPNSGLLVQKTIKIQIPQGSIVKTVKEIANEKIPQNGKENHDNASTVEYRNQQAINSEKEYNEWNLQSFVTIRSFADKMVTLNVGSIGLMVALLTFLSAQSSMCFKVGEILLFVGCFSLFLLSIVFFVLILFPTYMHPSNMYEFIRQKECAAKKLKILSIIAVVAYILALTLSLVLLLLAIF